MYINSSTITKRIFMTEKKLVFGRYDYAAFAAFTMYSVCAFVVPLMIVSIGRDLDFPIDDGGMGSGGFLHMTRSIFMVITLLICGWIAAKIGKRHTMAAAMFMMGAGITVMAFASAYWMLLPCLMIAGLGEGICEGLATPFVQDLHPDEPERYVSFGHAFWPAGIILSVFCISGALACGTAWQIPAAVSGTLTMLTALGFCWKEKKGREYPESANKLRIRDILQYTGAIVREKRFWLCCLAMFFGAGAEFGLTFWSAAYIQLNFQTSAFVAGLGTGAIALGMFLGRTGFGYISTPRNLRYILLFSALGTIPVSLLLVFLEPGMLPEWATFTLLFILLFLAGIGIAPYWPTSQVYGVTNLPHCDSTLLYIYYSTVGVPGAGIFSWLMGAAGDKFGLKGAIMVVPITLVVFIAVIVYECWIRKDKTFQPVR